MAKGKNSSTVKHEEPLITEEDRTHNPIFQTIYKRIRNLNKKLTMIDELLEKDPANLKPEQIKKIETREEVENQIKKNEEFALFYKGIINENKGVCYNTFEEVKKISTLLAVGQSIDQQEDLGDDKVLQETYHKVYRKISNYEDINEPIVEKIADNITVLTQFLNNKDQFRSCQDYISYQPSEKIKNNKKLPEKTEKVRKDEKKQKIHKKQEAQKEPEVKQQSGKANAPKNKQSKQEIMEIPRKEFISEQNIKAKIEKPAEISKEEPLNQEQSEISKNNNKTDEKPAVQQQKSVSNINEKTPANDAESTKTPYQKNIQKHSDKIWKNKTNYKQKNPQNKNNDGQHKNTQNYRKNNRKNNRQNYKGKHSDDSSLEPTPEKTQIRYIQKK